MAVFSYHVDKDHSEYIYDFHDGQKGALAFGGSLYLDGDSYQVMKMTYSAEIMPADWPVIMDSGAIDCGLVEIGGTQFIMPLHAEGNGALRNGNQIRNVTEFTNYHKFSSDTKIDFGK